MGLEKSYGVNKNRKIYGNYQVFSPDNILMFRCNQKKANWYLNRDLAEIINDNTIKLKFVPSGLGNHNKEFGLTTMINCCVCCGTEEYLTRHHVVPYCYRRFFPLELKSHNFHDVLSLCATCHEKYERSADKLKEALSIEYEAPINGIFEKNQDIKYSKIAVTLLRNDKSIPKNKINYMKFQIRKYLGIKKVSKKQLIDLSNIKSIILNKTHGEIVMEKITDIQPFVEMWREHFINNNNCKYLPENWSIKNKIH